MRSDERSKAMLIFPAIDLYEKKAVRLFKGDYNQMTVYNDDPAAQAKAFEKQGATHIHLVDLEGARDGTTPNLDVIQKIRESTNLFLELGGGIRNMETAEKYLSIGVDRVILGTAAVTDEAFLTSAANTYKEKIAVGVDVRDGYVSIKGWTEQSGYTLDAFCEKLEKLGIHTVICTDISKDGAMKGANLPLYKNLSEKYTMNFIASGGVSSLDDVRALADMKLYGAIIGKAYYTGAVDLAEAIKVGRKDNA